jgi:DNA-binding IclR family transcriptional regulator
MRPTAKRRTAANAKGRPRHAAVRGGERSGTVGQRAGVQSLGRAFAILEEIGRNRDGIGLADLSKRVGLHNSTAFHLVKTLVSLGYVRQLPDTKRYRIGRPLFALAASALDEIEMTSLATPILESLSRDCGESAHYAVRLGDATVTLARTSGPGAFQFVDRAGAVRPAHCTALGKVMLAALRPEQLEQYLGRAELKAYTSSSITSPERLRREIVEVQKRGVAFDNGEFDSEVRCVAAPVRDFSGQVVGAVGVSGPVWRSAADAMERRVDLIREAAERLSAEFGYAAPVTKAAE